MYAFIAEPCSGLARPNRLIRRVVQEQKLSCGKTQLHLPRLSSIAPLHGLPRLIALPPSKDIIHSIQLPFLFCSKNNTCLFTTGSYFNIESGLEVRGRRMVR